MTTRSPRYRLPVAVYGLLVVDGRLLLLRRAGSGYADGRLSLPAGHLEVGEDAVQALVRELAEELAIEAEPASCRLATVLHRAPESADDHAYLDLFFSVGRWSGAPVIGEPDRCSELVWAEADRLPAEVVDYVATALKTVRDGTPFLALGW